MADILSTFDLNGLASSLFPLVILAIALVVFALIGGILYVGGFFKRYRYKLTIWEPRSDGGWEDVQAKGDFLKNGKFEVSFGFNDKMEVVAPAGATIRPNKKIHGISRQRNDITWISTIKINDGVITAEPLNDPGVKVTIVNGMKEEVDRYEDRSKWKEYLPMASLIAAAIIIMLPILMGLGTVADKIGKAQLSCGASEVHIIYGNQTVAAFPGVPAPTSNRPPG